MHTHVYLKAPFWIPFQSAYVLNEQIFMSFLVFLGAEPPIKQHKTASWAGKRGQRNLRGKLFVWPKLPEDGHADGYVLHDSFLGAGASVGDDGHFGIVQRYLPNPGHEIGGLR